MPWERAKHLQMSWGASIYDFSCCLLPGTLKKATSAHIDRESHLQMCTSSNAPFIYCIYPCWHISLECVLCTGTRYLNCLWIGVVGEKEKETQWGIPAVVAVGVGERLGEVGSRCWKSRIECSQDLTAGSSTNSWIPNTMSIPVTMSSFYYEYSC